MKVRLVYDLPSILIITIKTSYVIKDGFIAF